MSRAIWLYPDQGTLAKIGVGGGSGAGKQEGLLRMVVVVKFRLVNKRSWVCVFVCVGRGVCGGAFLILTKEPTYTDSTGHVSLQSLD